MMRVVAAAVLTLLPMTAQAQTACEPQLRIGGAASLLNVDVPVDPQLAGGSRFGLAKASGLGLEPSIHVGVPIHRQWSVIAEFGTGSLDVLLVRDEGNTVNRKTGDEITLRRLNVGLLRYSPAQYACVYWSARVGLYRFDYRGVSLNVPGGAGAIGVEVPVSDSGAVFFETELNFVLTEARPPVTPAGALANVRPALGFRFKF